MKEMYDYYASSNVTFGGDRVIVEKSRIVKAMFYVLTKL